ncbi:hypothetical protein ITP53_06795 [Nonomuraea sp. K274]|uniref:Uncharacterized protein n=1 Tax=Nonomuraea cypriaca TaxID=1187855 RepID=A0A931EWQ3_9ACTN|nr:hypothetical protein [Nonomuraea cypriaca]MBF8185450.1 hypothetical protein [Nonomuraea cypriaca]
MAGLDPQPWPGLDDSDDELFYDVSKMRSVAEALETALVPTQGPGSTGSVEAVTGDFSLDEQHIGEWPAASAFARSVSTLVPDTSTYGPYYLGRGQQLAGLYREYVECCRQVIQAIRDSADVYENTNPVQGDAGK